MTLVFAVFIIPCAKKKLIKTDFQLLEVVTFQERIREVKFLKSVTISHELNAVKQELCLWKQK